MANFICPFSKKVCSPNCEHWVFEGKTPSLSAMLPLRFGGVDVLQGVLSRILPVPLSVVLSAWCHRYEMCHPKTSTSLRGRCLKIEKLREKGLTEIE